MPLKQSRIPRLLARVEHDLKRRPELIPLAITATLANWKVYPILCLDAVSSMAAIKPCPTIGRTISTTSSVPHTSNSTTLSCHFLKVLTPTYWSCAVTDFQQVTAKSPPRLFD